MDGNYPDFSNFPPPSAPVRRNRIPSITNFSARFDPTGTGFRSLFSQNSTPSGNSFPSGNSAPSAPSQASGTDDSEQQIYDLLFPINPNDQSRQTVIGVYTSGSNTRNKIYLPIIYNIFGLEFCCHSCGVLLKDSFIGDHQPPSTLRESAARGAISGPGKYGQILRIMQQAPTVNLYKFELRLKAPDTGHEKKIHFQTNDLELLNRMQIPISNVVNYPRDLTSQYLYPHCSSCSNKQGRLLM